MYDIIWFESLKPYQKFLVLSTMIFEDIIRNITKKQEGIFIFTMIFICLLYIRVLIINAIGDAHKEYKSLFYRTRFYAFGKLYFIFPLFIYPIKLIRDYGYIHEYRSYIFFVVFITFKIFYRKFLKTRRYKKNKVLEECKLYEDLKFDYNISFKDLKKKPKSLIKRHLYKLLYIHIYKYDYYWIINFLCSSFFLYKMMVYKNVVINYKWLTLKKIYAKVFFFKSTNIEIFFILIK